MIKISVVVPTYEPKDYLSQCIDSLCYQSLPSFDFEIIIVLNGIKTPYEDFVKSIICKHGNNNIILLYSEKSGVSSARNLGIENAKGEFIAFVDDDDYVSETYLEELYEKSDAQTIALAYPYAFNDGEPECQLKYSITDEFLRCSKNGKQSFLKPKKFFSGPCMKLIHRDIIGDRRFDERFKNGEDSIFMFLISDKMKMVDFVSMKSIYYRRFRNNSATMSLKTNAYIIRNCYDMFKIYSNIYFNNIKEYSFTRYFTNLLGLIHIIVENIIIEKYFKA